MDIMKNETRTVEEIKNQEEFNYYQLTWIKHVEETIEYGNKTFKRFAIDPTQIPCLLMMNMIDYLKTNFDEETYDSFKYFVHEVLEGNIPKPKPKLVVVKNETQS